MGVSKDGNAGLAKTEGGKTFSISFFDRLHFKVTTSKLKKSQIR